MKTVYSGFDTIIFAVKGALEPSALERLETSKSRAKENNAEALVTLGNKSRELHVRPHGLQGGYAYVLSTGTLGEQISIKDSFDRTEWNGFVKLYSVTLAVLGRQGAMKQAMQTLDDIGFHHVEISLNRVDFCVDILNAEFILNPHNFIAHARATKTSYIDRSIQGSSRSDTYETVTVGKSPGLQVSIYDKRREVTVKRKSYWFDFWDIDKNDPTLTVHRVEVRAGKNELKKYNLTTWDDFENKIGDVICTALTRVRYVQSLAEEQNVTRQPLHPVWLHVQSRVKTHLFEHISNVEPSRVLYVMREAKKQEYVSQIIGLSGGLAVCLGIDLEDVANHVPDLIKAAMQDMGFADTSPLRKSYGRACERLVFIANNAHE